MKTFLKLFGSGAGIVCFGVILNSCSTSTNKTASRLHVVQIQSMQFQPAELPVQKGDTVVFVNKDILVHDVTEAKSRAWSSSPLSTEQVYQLVVLESADYYCSFHPVMKGKLVLQ